MLPPPRPVTALNETTLLEHVAFSSTAALSYLNLHASGLKRVAGLDALQTLTTLVLSFNAVERLEGLSRLSLLTRLDLSHNHIKEIDGLDGCPKLKLLDLSFNDIQMLSDCANLTTCAPALDELWLAGNPTCDMKGYRSLVFRQLPHLKLLDGESATSTREASISGPRHSLTVQLILSHSLDAHGRSYNQADGMEVADWLRHVELLSVPHCHLWRIAMLDRLPGLMRLNLADNEIMQIEGACASGGGRCFGCWMAAMMVDCDEAPLL